MMAWEPGMALGLGFSAGGGDVALVMYSVSGGGKWEEIQRCLLGYDFHVAAEEEEAVFVSAELGLIGLPSEDGYSLFSYGEEGFRYLRSAYTGDYSGNQRLLCLGEYLYVADTSRVNIFRLSDMALVDELYL